MIDTAAPTRVCPHCHAQSETTGKRCPHCGKKFKRRGFLSKLLIAAVVFVILMALAIGGCAALIGEAANEVQKESDKNAIERADFDAVTQGMTRAQVEAKLGEPADVQETEIDTSAFEGAGASSTHDCIYYNKKGEILPAYQLCFEDGKLSSKSTY